MKAKKSTYFYPLYALFLVIVLPGCNSFNFLQKYKLLMSPQTVDVKTAYTEASFDWSWPDKPSGRTFTFGSSIKNKKVTNSYFELKYENTLPEKLTLEEKAKFKKKTIATGDKTKTVYIYSYGQKKERKKKKRSQYQVIQKKLLKKIETSLERKFVDAQPQKLTIPECAFLINQKKVLFLTGAGLSLAAGIPTFPVLFKDLGFELNQMIDPMVKTSLKYPEKIITIITKFHQAFWHARPTPAHTILTKLALHKQTQIITGNVDFLHKLAGIEPYKIGAPYPDFNIEKDLSESVAKKIDAIICIGSSFDFRGFLGRYKRLNPLGIIVAININQPYYLGNEDFFIQGDAQKIIAKLGEMVMKN